MLPSSKNNTKRGIGPLREPIDSGKIPPQALDLEEAVLGALLIDKDAVSTVIDILDSKVFYKQAHSIVFEAVEKLFQNSQPIDLLTVSSYLRDQGLYESVGGGYFLSGLANRVGSAANVEFHARIIMEKFIRRELIRISSEIVTDSFDESIDTFDLLNESERKLFDIAQGNIRRTSESMGQLLSSALKQIEEARKDKSSLTGVPTGFTRLDSITAGWQPSDLIIVAARPAMGKTAFSLSLARNAAVDFQVPVAVFSLEMSALQLVTRLISAECHISSDKLRKGDLNDAEWERLHSQLGSLAEANIYINDTPALNVFEFRANARRLKQHKNIGLIVVDYLQLMTAHSDKKGGMREQEISTISRSLKAVAKELNIPIIALSQLSRAVETRPGDKKPQLSDLRESGAIEQDADMVCFIYRPEYYGIKEVDGKSMEGIAKIIIAKHRNGELDEVDLEFVSQYVKFINLAPGRDQFPNGFGGGSFNPETRTLTLPSRMDNSSDEDEDPLGDTPF